MMQVISWRWWGCLLPWLLAAAPPDPLLSGVEAFEHGDYALAERDLTLATQQSHDPRAAAFLALTQAVTNRCDLAIGGLETAWQQEKGALHRLSGLALGQCRLTRSEIDAATGVVGQLRNEFPHDADVLYLAARLHMRAWNETLRLLYQEAPASFRVNQISGEVLETQGRFNEAAEEYRKAIQKNPNAVNLHFRLGRALLMSSHDPKTLDAALAEFDAELKLNPRDPICHYQVAQVYLAQEKREPAEARLKNALDLQPEFPEALLALGKLELDQKQYPQAIRLLQKAAQLTPTSEPAHYNLMLAYRNSGDLASAKKEKAVLDRLQKPPEGEFSDFLKKLGEKPAEKGPEQ